MTTAGGLPHALQSGLSVTHSASFCLRGDPPVSSEGHGLSTLPGQPPHLGDQAATSRLNSGESNNRHHCYRLPSLYSMSFKLTLPEVMTTITA